MTLYFAIKYLHALGALAKTGPAVVLPKLDNR